MALAASSNASCDVVGRDSAEAVTTADDPNGKVVADVEAAAMVVVDSRPMVELIFEESRAGAASKQATADFYARLRQLCTDGAPFRIRLPTFRTPGEIPAKLRVLLQAAEGCARTEEWSQALTQARLGESVDPFDIFLEREFDANSHLMDEWHDWDARLQHHREKSGAHAVMINTPFPSAANSGHGLTTLAGYTYYGTRYAFSWSRGQDRRRWRWIASLAATGGLVAGALSGGLAFVAGAAIGATSGIVSSGSRKAQVVIGQSGIVITCP